MKQLVRYIRERFLVKLREDIYNSVLLDYVLRTKC